MKEVHPNLFVGTEDDERTVRDHPDWFIVSAAKDPWHRQALGYTGRGAPKDHPEYLAAHRPGRLILNLVDVDDPKYIAPELMAEAAHTIDEFLSYEDKKVLVHCNQGRSRSPSVALWYMHNRTDDLPTDHDEAVTAFTKLYPDYAPARGMSEFIRTNW